MAKQVKLAGNDTLIGIDGQWNYLYGDATSLSGHAVGGNDTLTGGAGGDGVAFTYNELFGDAYQLYSSARGGNDLLTGGADAENHLYGDAGGMYDSTRGGADTLIGGTGAAAINILRGDAQHMFGNAVGGNDTLIGGAGATNTLYGDAYDMYDSAVCGNDVLISGTGTDHMWGDAVVFIGGSVTTGADTFVFKPASGNDFIYDFQSDHDKIDVSAYGFANIGAMTITDLGNDTKMDFDSGNSVILVGFSDPSLLTGADFKFA